MDIRSSRRPSGAAYVLEREPHSHAVSLGFWFTAGSGTESESERGFTHFAEHMLFKGTTTRDARSLAGGIERAGGYLNAFTEKNNLCLHCTLPASNWPIAVEFLGDMAFRSVFDPREFEREKDVIRSEVLAVRDDPEEDSADEYHARIWEGHPLSRRVAGDSEDVCRINRDSLYAYYLDRFKPLNLVVSAAGDFEPEAMEDALDRILEGFPRGLRVSKPLPPAFKNGYWTHPASTGQVYLIAGTVVEKRFTRKELNALDALNCAFGESSSSRLFQNIREAYGLCYSIGSSFASSDSLGAFYITAASSARQFPRLWDRIQVEVESLRRNGLDEKEVSDAVAHLYGQDVVSADDMETRMRVLARQWLRDGFAEPYVEFIDRIRSVDLNQVLEARDTLFASPLSALAYGRIGVGVRRALGNPGTVEKMA